MRNRIFTSEPCWGLAMSREWSSSQETWGMRQTKEAILRSQWLFTLAFEIVSHKGSSVRSLSIYYLERITKVHYSSRHAQLRVGAHPAEEALPSFLVGCTTRVLGRRGRTSWRMMLVKSIKPRQWVEPPTELLCLALHDGGLQSATDARRTIFQC